MLTPEQVAEIRKDAKSHWYEDCERRFPDHINSLLRDRAEIAAELQSAYDRRRETGYSLTAAITALIERIKVWPKNY